MVTTILESAGDLVVPPSLSDATAIRGTARFEPGGGRVEFMRVADGSYLLEYSFGSRGPCQRAYSAKTMRFVDYCPATSNEKEFLVFASGLPSAGIESRERDLFYVGHAYFSDGLYLRLRELDQGRDELVGEAVVSVVLSPAGEPRDTSQSELTAKVDLGTGLLLELELASIHAESSSVKEWFLTSLEVPETLPDFDAVVSEIASRSGSPATIDYGFSKVEVSALPSLVPYSPVYLERSDATGFVVDVVYFANESVLPSARDNPPTREVVVFVYRRGLEVIVVTNRLLRVAVEGDGLSGFSEAGDWHDPFVVDGWTTGRAEIPIEASPFGSIVADFSVVPHTWAVIGNSVVTVEGNVDPRVLRAFAEELGRAAGE